MAIVRPTHEELGKVLACVLEIKPNNNIALRVKK
jgi:hypothetical protein